VTGTLPSALYRRLATAPVSELRDLMLDGDTPNVTAFAGRDFRGYNRLWLLSLIRARTFIKRFSADGSSGANVRVRQKGLRGPWVPMPGAKPYGPFAVTLVGPESRDNAYLHAVLFDYSRRGFAFSPLRLLRDYVVTMSSAGDTVLLGRAYLAVLWWRIPTSFFLLELQDREVTRGTR
jgi:hypothetical protein